MARLRAQHSRGSRGERGRACSEARGESEDPAGDQALSPARDSGGKVCQACGLEVASSPLSVPHQEGGSLPARPAFLPLVPPMAELTAQVELGAEWGGESLKSQLKPSLP